MLYAHWELVKYTITYKDAPVNNNKTEFTIEDEIILTEPEWFGLAFKNWTDENGVVVDKINKGTTGNITITANWMSERNLAVPSNSEKSTAIFFDEESERYYFIYDLGTIENIILSTIRTKDKGAGEPLKWTFKSTISVENNVAKTVARTISESVSHTDSWNTTRNWAKRYSESLSSSITAGLEVEEFGVTAKIEAKIEATETTEKTKSYEHSNSGSDSTGTETSDSVSSTVSYKKGNSETVEDEVNIPGDMPKGKYSHVWAGTAHVYAVVTYDPEKRNYYVDTFSIMNDNIYEKTMYDAPANTTANITVSEGLPLNIGNYEEEIQTYINSTYVVKYNANGGEGSMLASLHSIGIPSKLLKNNFKRAGYDFSGWEYISNSQNVIFADEESVNDIADKRGIVTLYAQWTPITYTISYVLNDGEKLLNGNYPDKYNVENVPELSILIHKNYAKYYEFDGWFFEKECKKPYSKESLKANPRDITLYAKFKKADVYKDFTYINSAKSLHDAIVKNANGKFLLVGDIDCDGYSWTPIAFKGVLDGDGHTVSNWSYLQRRVGYIGMFTINSGTIKNINLESCYIRKESTACGELYAGILCGQNSGVIQNITAERCTVTTAVGKIDKDKDGITYAGILCGTSTGTVNLVTVQVCGVMAEAFSRHDDAQAYIGSVMGKASGTISHVNVCNNILYAYTKTEAYWNGLFNLNHGHGRPRAYNGAVVGYAENVSFIDVKENGNTLTTSTMRPCSCDTNTERCQGGMYGKQTKCKFKDC